MQASVFSSKTAISLGRNKPIITTRKISYKYSIYLANNLLLLLRQFFLCLMLAQNFQNAHEKFLNRLSLNFEIDSATIVITIVTKNTEIIVHYKNNEN